MPWGPAGPWGPGTGWFTTWVICWMICVTGAGVVELSTVEVEGCAAGRPRIWPSGVIGPNGPLEPGTPEASEGPDGPDRASMVAAAVVGSMGPNGPVEPGIASELSTVTEPGSGRSAGPDGPLASDETAVLVPVGPVSVEPLSVDVPNGPIGPTIVVESWVPAVVSA